ncbi:hypothetical protein AALO_G00185170, partial [Alosa alosa]
MTLGVFPCESAAVWGCGSCSPLIPVLRIATESFSGTEHRTIQAYADPWPPLSFFINDFHPRLCQRYLLLYNKQFHWFLSDIFTGVCMTRKSFAAGCECMCISVCMSMRLEETETWDRDIRDRATLAGDLGKTSDTEQPWLETWDRDIRHRAAVAGGD